MDNPNDREYADLFQQTAEQLAADLEAFANPLLVAAQHLGREGQQEAGYVMLDWALQATRQAIAASERRRWVIKALHLDTIARQQFNPS